MTITEQQRVSESDWITFANKSLCLFVKLKAIVKSTLFGGVGESVKENFELGFQYFNELPHVINFWIKIKNCRSSSGQLKNLEKKPAEFTEISDICLKKAFFINCMAVDFLLSQEDGLVIQYEFTKHVFSKMSFYSPEEVTLEILDTPEVMSQ